MIALFVFLSVFACTFVGCNEKLDGSAKAGFFMSYAVVCVLAFAASWLLG